MVFCHDRNEAIKTYLFSRDIHHKSVFIAKSPPISLAFGVPETIQRALEGATPRLKVGEGSQQKEGKDIKPWNRIRDISLPSAWLDQRSGPSSPLSS